MSIASERKAPWFTREYLRIAAAAWHGDELVVDFEDGTRARVDVAQLLQQQTGADWERLTFTPYEIIIPTDQGNAEVPWDVIRALSDRAFNQHLLDAAAEEAKSVGIRLTQLREERGLTVIVLAERAGIEPHVLSRFERGEDNVPLPTLQRIVAALECSLREFVVGVP